MKLLNGDEAAAALYRLFLKVSREVSATGGTNLEIPIDVWLNAMSEALEIIEANKINAMIHMP